MIASIIITAIGLFLSMVGHPIAGILITIIGFDLVIGFLARRRNRSFAAWFLLAFFVTPLVVIILFAIPNRARRCLDAVLWADALSRSCCAADGNIGSARQAPNSF